MIELNNVTAVIVDCYNYGLAISAIHKTLTQIKPRRTIFFTDIDYKREGFEVIKIDKIKSKNDYSHFIMKELYQYIDTEYVLIFQHDGYPIDSNCWTYEFQNYDYVGSRWNYPEIERSVGNGGCSLRSKKLLKAVATDDFIEITEQEDDAICRLYGAYLEQKHNIVFAPPKIADKWGFELRAPVNHTFSFHGYFHQRFKAHVIIRRHASLGDICMAEPLMAYYNDLGYQVVLDTDPQFMSLFFQHPYSIKHISQMDSRIEPIKIIDLNMAYENRPKMLALDAYFEMAGITDYKPRNARLNVNADSSANLFEKYVLIHSDDTGMEYRNEHGVDWKRVVKYLKECGYLVFQCGKRTKKQIAPHINTATIELLMFVIKGANLVIGLDSGICQIAVALNVPSVIMFGSVNPAYRYVLNDNIKIVHTDCPLDKNKFCYHEQAGSTVGKQCELNESVPPCSDYREEQIIDAINKLI